MLKPQEIIYPREAHPATRVLALIGALFLVSLAGLLVAFGITQLTNYSKNLASINETVNGGGRTASSSENIQIATSTAASTTENPGSTSDTNATSAPRITPISPGPKKTTTYTVGGGPAILPNGIPDLAVAVVDSGVLDGSGNFLSATSTNAGQQSAVVFDIANIGTQVTGPWRFAAHLPTAAGDFNSDVQDSLNPGEKIRYTIGFSQLKDQGANTVTIEADPTHQVINEANRSNDIASTTIIRNY